MSPPVILSPTADQVFEEAAAWYQKLAGLGERFVDQVQAALDRIGKTPELHATVYQNVRRVRVQRFPYSVFYRVLDHRIEVIAEFHDQRAPQIWRPRA